MTSSREAVLYFGDVVRRFLKDAGKSGHAPMLFDVRRRTMVGTYTYFDHLPDIVSAMEASSTPEQVGEVSRRLASTPANYQINSVPFGYLIGRQNELLLGRDGGSEADIDRIMDWWVRAMMAYRKGTLSSYDDEDRQRVVDDEVPLAALEADGLAVEQDPDYRKLTSALQVFNYVQRGEQRGTTFFHGPYPGAGGRTIFVEEFTRLRDNELPWASAEAFPVDTVCAIVETHDVSYRFELFQGMVASDPDYHDKVDRVAMVTREGDGVRRLTGEEREGLLAGAAEEQKRLFRETIAWDDEYKLVYGAYLYLDFIVPVMRAAKVPEVEIQRVREQFAETSVRRAREVIEMDPPVWGRLLADSGVVFDPA